MIECPTIAIGICFTPRWEGRDGCAPFRHCPPPYSDYLAVENRRNPEDIADFPPARPVAPPPAPAELAPYAPPPAGRAACPAKWPPAMSVGLSSGSKAPRLGDVSPVTRTWPERRIREFVRVSLVVGPGRFIDMLA